MSSARKPGNVSPPDWALSDSREHNSGQETATLPPPPLNPEDLSYYVRHHLSETERLVIMLRYAEELGFEEIASVLKVAQADIEEIHQMVVSRLKHALISTEALAGV